jgi:hypothetical protein
MIKPILLLVTLSLFRIQQDVRVVTYSSGKADSDVYESLSFWIKTNQRAYIRYAHGKDAEDVELNWAGTDTLGGGKGFRIRLVSPDTLNWVVVSKGNAIVVGDHSGRYRKEYHWENENGAGSADSTCTICAKDEKQAMGWLKRYFF